MRSFICGALFLFSAVSFAGPVQQEEFSTVAWQNHEDLSESVTQGDLIFSVPSGASLKGVTTPGGLMPGYSLAKPAQYLSIKPATNTYLSISSLKATDLYIMTNSNIKVDGYRGNQVVVSQVAGPLWSVADGIDINLTGFFDLSEVRISSDVVDPVNSSVYFFLDTITYQVDDNFLDSDNDGYADYDEIDNGTNPNDGSSIPPDNDGDFLSDLNDSDDDNDGVLDGDDAFPFDPTETTDSDGDGIGNNADPDDDNDGYTDSDETDNGTSTTDPLDTPADNDGDFTSDLNDDDDDNDGTPDNTDAFPFDPSETTDTDGDGVGNNTDTDDDNGGVLDGDDAFPLDDSESVDTDNDGTGNNADTDDDNDGVLEGDDAFPLDDSESVDTDNDGTGNNADTDDDNDGVLDGDDAFPLDDSESVDTDSDGTGNNADTDDDNDGVLDGDDAFPLDDSESVDTDG